MNNLINPNKILLVIIVTYNAMKWAERCFGSLKNSSVPNDVFVVDNGSTDGTQEFIRKNYPKVIFQQSAENLGFGRANNIGLQYAIKNDYDYVYLLNQDAWVMPETFENMLQAFYKRKEYGILVPLQYEANKKRLDKNFAYNLCKWPICYELLNNIFQHDIKDVISVDFEMAAHWMISHDCFVKVGLFSSSFPHYGEDNNYAQRVHYHGFLIGVVTSAMAIHDREYRVNSKEKEMYLDYISAISDISNINDSCKFTIVRNIYYLLTHTIKYKSLCPVKYAWKLTKQLREILKNKETTKSIEAFVKYGCD